MCCDFLLKSSILQVVTAIWNMARHHKEFHAPLDNVEKLRLYAQSTVSKHQALNVSLAKARFWSKHWEQEAKAGVKKAAGEEKERDKAKKEA